MKTILSIFLTLFISVAAIGAPAGAFEANVTDYGAFPNDGIDDTVAIMKAVTATLDEGGGEVKFPAGVFDVCGVDSKDSYNGQPMKNGILIRDHGQGTDPHDKRLTIVGEGKSTRLRLCSDHMFGIRIATSNTTIRDLTIEGTTAANLDAQDWDKNQIALAIVPANLQDESTRTHGSNNAIERVYVHNVGQALYIKCGPEPSDCYRNSITDFAVRFALIGINTEAGPGANGFTPNRNRFDNVNINWAHIGVYLRGDTNTLSHLEVNNIRVPGSLAPDGIPTGIVMPRKSGNWSVQGNVFVNVPHEGNTRDLWTDACRNTFFGYAFSSDPAKNVMPRDGVCWNTMSTGIFFGIPSGSEWYPKQSGWLANPAIPTGALYFDQDNNLLKIFKEDGTWLDLGAGGGGSTAPAPASQLDVMTTAERDQITNPPPGRTIYNSETGHQDIFTPDGWRTNNLQSR